MSEQQGGQPQFNPDAPHQVRPKLRRIRLFPMPVQTPDGKQAVVLGIADAQQISPKIVGTAPAFQPVLPMLDGSRTVDEIVAEVGRGLSAELLQSLVAQLDDAGLLEGPNAEAMIAETRKKFDESDTLPPGSTAQFADALVMAEVGEEATDEQKNEMGPAKMTAQFDAWIDEALKPASNPAFDALPSAVITPHLDYPRGWVNYASVYGRLRTVERPDRVIILGTNHFGSATGICGCDKGYETPLGVCRLDQAFVDVLRSKLGDAAADLMFADRFDHENEHSVELQIPWIQHVFGANDAGEFVPVFGVLVHDPVQNNGESYDGKGLALDPFVEALQAAIAEAPGKTLIVSSADLSHVGPAFGDQQRTTGEEGDEAVEAFRKRVTTHDQEMLGLIKDAKSAELIGSMAWQQNPTRWCSVGNIVAALRAVDAEQVEILNYTAAVDGGGNTMVTSCAAVVG